MTRPIWHSLTGRLTLAFMLLSLLSLGLVGLLSYLSVREGYRQLTTGQIQVRLSERLRQYVLTHGSVAGYSRLQDGPGGPAAPESGPGDPADQGRPPPLSQQVGGVPGNPPDDEGGPFRVLDAQYHLLGSAEAWPVARRAGGIPVAVSGRVVAYLLPTGNYPPLDARSTEFLSRTRQAILAVMLLAGLLAVGLGSVLARTLLLPLRQLLGGIEAMQRGQPVQVQPSRRNDELDELLQAFHAMTRTVRHQQQVQRQLTADIAHDLNTPLSVISGSLEAMLDGTFAPDPPRLTRLHRESLHASALVRDLRFLALVDAGELQLNFKEIDLGQLIVETVQGLQEQALQGDVTVTWRVPAVPVHVQLDPVRIVQVLHNLIGNALAHTGPGDHVSVSIETEAEAVQISVQDTGSGIAPEALPYVFDRLYRADSARSRQGSGLGLSISRSIVETHGGTICLSSVLNRGTTAVVQLPLERKAEDRTGNTFR